MTTTLSSRRTDSELVELTRAGQDLAYETLVARHQPALVAFARSLLGGRHHDAEEAVQDAFVRALAALRRDPGREIALRPWLFAITRNACVDRLRRDRGTVDLDLVGAVLADRTAGPEAQLAGRERLRGLVGGLLELPERQRQALVGLELEGRSHEEVAAGLGVSVAASKALVCRARQGVAHLRDAA